MTDVINPERYVAQHSDTANLARLAEPHQRVKIRHTGSPENPMVVRDRNGEWHKFLPGESKGIDLPVSEIEQLREWRRPGRIVDLAVQVGEDYKFEKREAPLHPLL